MGNNQFFIDGFQLQLGNEIDIFISFTFYVDGCMPEGYTDRGHIFCSINRWSDAC